MVPLISCTPCFLPADHPSPHAHPCSPGVLHPTLVQSPHDLQALLLGPSAGPSPLRRPPSVFSSLVCWMPGCKFRGGLVTSQCVSLPLPLCFRKDSDCLHSTRSWLCNRHLISEVGKTRLLVPHSKRLLAGPSSWSWTRHAFGGAGRTQHPPSRAPFPPCYPRFQSKSSCISPVISWVAPFPAMPPCSASAPETLVLSSLQLPGTPFVCTHCMHEGFLGDLCVAGALTMLSSGPWESPDHPSWSSSSLPLAVLTVSVLFHFPHFALSDVIIHLVAYVLIIYHFSPYHKLDVGTNYFDFTANSFNPSNWIRVQQITDGK